MTANEYPLPAAYACARLLGHVALTDDSEALEAANRLDVGRKFLKRWKRGKPRELKPVQLQHGVVVYATESCPLYPAPEGMEWYRSAYGPYWYLENRKDPCPNGCLWHMDRKEAQRCDVCKGVGKVRLQLEPKEHMTRKRRECREPLLDSPLPAIRIDTSDPESLKRGVERATADMLDLGKVVVHLETK